VPGGAPGLQNQCGADKVPGGFDSHSPPPFITAANEGKTICLYVADIKSKLKEYKNRTSMDEVSMLTKKTKIIIFCLLISLGVIVLAYGAFFHSITVTTKVEGGSVSITKSEPALVKEASVGGVARDKSGKIKQTYTGKAPEACPT
jgi:hypothetical protein